MPTIFDALNIGVSGIFVNKAAINTTGNNVANVNTPGYSRERVDILPSMPMYSYAGVFGTGAKIDQIISTRDELIDRRVRASNQEMSYYNKLNSSMDEIQSIFNEENGVGLKGAMDQFFNAWHALSLNPDLETARQQVIEKGLTLSKAIKDANASLNQIKTNLDDQVSSTVTEINSLSKRIAQLNYEIKKAELGDKDHANTLRDQRSVLLEKLSSIADVTILEGSYNNQTKPEMTVLLGGMPLVSGKDYNELTAEKLNGSEYYRVYFVEPSNAKVDITSRIKNGSLGAILNLRDKIISEYKNNIDEIAKTLIQEINKIHSSGAGLTPYSQIEGIYAADPNAALSIPNATGLDIAVKTGSFKLKVIDENNNEVGVFTIPVNEDDHLQAQDPSDEHSLIERFNNIMQGYAQMSISPAGKVQIKAIGNYKFAFTYDSSNLLAATGINTFFTGHNSSDIDVNRIVQNDPSKIAAGKTLNPGDSSNAQTIAQVQLNKVMVNNTQTIDEYYNAFLGSIGSTKQRFDEIYKAKEAVYQQLKTTQQSLEGVSLDEEAANLIKFQRAYQANAKFISVVDDMTQTLINMVR
ncbi:flagellar hook-associated protein FlgK [Hippea maritima]|uniref:Flagellar hook-associated protein 1 n=1 Tax=Hippea maritima (strain ATCC 700847 / DSM 10411 / MH2) TaxID=760142 RepID=F2LY22_HIPMA|nr:flagellar hook-associated protein FlgK [Hippea maritima]AEA33287.1 flagellar hook-associated protein FlgK [Hippea maritima DSM 10411]